MEMRMDVWVEDPNDSKRLVQATLVVTEVPMERIDKILSVRCQTLIGDVFGEFFEIDLDQWRVALNAFSSREASVLASRDGTPR